MVFYSLHVSVVVIFMTFVCFNSVIDAVDVSDDDALSEEEAEDSEFWEGVTKPGRSRTSASQSDGQVQEMVLLLEDGYVEFEFK